MLRPELRLSPGGDELRPLAGAVAGAARARGRRVVGIAGAPGAGKSRLAGVVRVILEQLGVRVVVVPLDGFHLSDAELDRQGLLDRKGAPETFDGWGYAGLLSRIRSRPGHPVYAPGFERDLEQPIAQALAVEADVEVVLTEGNYLLLDRPEWRAGRSFLDETWFVRTDEELRRRRLVARHVEFGKSPETAATWVTAVDEPNARLVASTAAAADLVLELRNWDGVG